MAETEPTEKIVVIADSATATGFRLAGIDDTFPVSTREEAGERFREVFSRAEFGIIVTTEKIAESLDRKTKQRVSASAKPVVITVPGIEGPIEQTESIAKLIKRALGVQLKQDKI